MSRAQSSLLTTFLAARPVLERFSSPVEGMPPRRSLRNGSYREVAHCPEHLPHTPAPLHPMTMRRPPTTTHHFPFWSLCRAQCRRHHMAKRPNGSQSEGTALVSGLLFLRSGAGYVSALCPCPSRCTPSVCPPTRLRRPGHVDAGEDLYTAAIREVPPLTRPSSNPPWGPGQLAALDMLGASGLLRTVQGGAGVCAMSITFPDGGPHT